MAKRNLVEITLEEAITVLKLGEGFFQDSDYQLRVNPRCFDGEFAQLFYTHGGQERVAVNFSDTKDAVSLAIGNKYYRTYFRIIKYLESRDFDLDSADKV